MYVRLCELLIAYNKIKCSKDHLQLNLAFVRGIKFNDGVVYIRKVRKLCDSNMAYEINQQKHFYDVNYLLEQLNAQKVIKNLWMLLWKWN